MGKGLISFMFAAGFSAWVYQKFQRYTGNNTQTSAIATGVTGILTFIIVLLLLQMILPDNG